MTSLNFGPLVLGGNVFGWTADKSASFAVLDAFVAAGGSSIDTADVYSAWVPGHTGGESERIIGEWLASRGNREALTIASKVFMLESRPGLSPENVRAAIDDSLRRLRTDYLDLYYAHRDDETVPQEEYVAVFDELVRAGKVREVGASQFAPERLRSAVGIAKTNQLTAFTVSQDQYNLVERAAESELLPTLRELDMVELPFFGLARGFLTGKYRPGARIDSPRAADASGYLNTPANLALLDTLDAIARTHRVPVAAVALAWLRQQSAVAAPIASARSTEQLDALLASFTLELAPDELTLLGS